MAYVLVEYVLLELFEHRCGTCCRKDNISKGWDEGEVAQTYNEKVRSMYFTNSLLTFCERCVTLRPGTTRNGLRRSTFGAFVMLPVNYVQRSMCLVPSVNPGLLEIDVRGWRDIYMIVSLSLSSRMIPNSQFSKNKSRMFLFYVRFDGGMGSIKRTGRERTRDVFAVGASCW